MDSMQNFSLKCSPGDGGGALYALRLVRASVFDCWTFPDMRLIYV